MWASTYSKGTSDRTSFPQQGVFSTTWRSGSGSLVYVRWMEAARCLEASLESACWRSTTVGEPMDADANSTEGGDVCRRMAQWQDVEK